MLTKFVDRADELAALNGALAALRGGRGSALVFEGRSGIGKSSLLEQVLCSAEAAGSEVRAVFTRPLPGIGAGLAYAPVVEILLGLQPRRPGQRSRLRRMLRGAGAGAAKSAPDVLKTLVPGLAPLLALGRAATESALKAGSMPLDSLLPFQQSVALRIAEEIESSARSGRPAMVVIDDVQYIDSSSLLVVDLLLRRIRHMPVLLVLALTRQPQPDPSARTVESLIDKWCEDRLITRRHMDGLPLSAVEELVGLLQPAAPVELPARLAETTGGLPVFVTLCLDQWRPDDGAQVVLPESVAELVGAQLAALNDVDRRLLTLASIQGVTFVSSLLARVSDVPHEDVLERLHALSRTRQLIRATGAKPDWAVHEDADTYQFDHLLTWDAVYHQQSEEQRRSRHERTARTLAATAPDTDGAPIGLRLELARQLELAGRPCLAESAVVRQSLARSAAIGGLSFAEAEMHCMVAIAAARAMPEGAERDRHLVASIEMLLSMTEVRWRGQASIPGVNSDIDGLAAEAEQAAARAATPEMIAVTTLLRGKTLMATRGLEPGLAKLAEAVERAAVLDDPVRLYIAKVEYGRQASKRKLAEGLAVLREADRLYADARLAERDDLVLRHSHNLCEMQLAVTLFDSGELEEALTRLLNCSARLRDEPLNAELPIALNYLAQVQIALGLTDGAQATLREALDFEGKRGGDSGWHAYNAALLASVLSGPRRETARALELAGEAWQETQRTWLINLVPIVRNLYAEVLLEASAAADSDLAAAHLERAANLAEETCQETLSSGMTRSRIAALILLARIHVRCGRSTQGAHCARRALGVLEEVGDMPALRTEEVYFHAASVLWLDGDEQEARELLDRAREAVAAKAARLRDAGLRRGFERDVPLNRWISAGLPAGEEH